MRALTGSFNLMGLLWDGAVFLTENTIEAWKLYHAVCLEILELCG